MSGYGLMSLEREKENIERLVFTIGFQYIRDHNIRSIFFADEQRIVDNYFNEYRYGNVDFSQAMNNLREHFQNLNHELIQLQMGSVQMYAIAQRARDASSLKTLSLKGVGFASGAFQVVGGTGVCVKDVRAACGKWGIPLMIQGAENVYENAYYLFKHEDPKSVPVRDAYRYIAKLLGGDNDAGDIAFSAVDLSLSAGSLASLTRLDGARKLFYHIREDFIRGWQAMGLAGLGTEMIGNSSSAFSIYKIVSEPDTVWSDLKENTESHQ